MQPLSLLKGKERGRGEITINASASDGRQNNAHYYKHTDASKQFQQARHLTRSQSTLLCLLEPRRAPCQRRSCIHLYSTLLFVAPVAPRFLPLRTTHSNLASCQNPTYRRLWVLIPEECCQEWEEAKARQDKALDNIEKGLGVLKGLGQAMGENLSQQDILLTEIDTKASAYLPSPFLLPKQPWTQIWQSPDLCKPYILASSTLSSHSCLSCADACIIAWAFLKSARNVQMDLANRTLKTNNMKLKGLVTQVSPLSSLSGRAWWLVPFSRPCMSWRHCCALMTIFLQMRSSKNFCIDVALICGQAAR